MCEMLASVQACKEACVQEGMWSKAQRKMKIIDSIGRSPSFE
jgi:hypothetical protein